MSDNLIQQRAQLTPGRPALWADGRWLDYAELDRRGARLASRLAALGIRRGDRVALLALNHPAHIDLAYATARLGYIHAPFNYRLSAQELRTLAATVAPSLLFVDARHAELASAFDCPAIRLDDYEAWLAAGSAEPPAAPALARDDIAMMLFTGGSTGPSKGALIPYRQLLDNADATVAGWSLDDGDCAIQATPCFHAALNVLTTPLLRAGARVVLMAQFEPGEYLRLLQQTGASLMFLTPTMYQMLAQHADFAAADFLRVRWAISGGAPCPPPVHALLARRGVALRQGYGMTEAGVNCFAIGAQEAAAQPLAVGRPLRGLDAAILRADGSLCGPGEIGELTLAGEQVCAGYFAREAEWRGAFRGGRLWTGDLASRDAQGLYTIRGRRKEMYISGGENVYPVEVEAALSQCTGVAECAVLGVADPFWGETGLAAVVLQPQVQCSAAELRAELKTRLAGYKLPQHFLLLPALPRSGAGKIYKPEIRRLWEGRGCSNTEGAS